MDKLRNRYLKLSGYANITRHMALISLAISFVAYIMHLVINNKVSVAIFSITFLLFILQFIVNKVINIIMLLVAIKIDKQT